MDQSEAETVEAPSSDGVLRVAEKAERIFETGYRFYGLHGGRGSSKSHAFATKGIVRMVQRKFRLLCCREVQRSIANSVHQLLCNKIDQGGVRDYFEITESYIRGPNESLALFRGLRIPKHPIARSDDIRSPIPGYPITPACRR